MKVAVISDVHSNLEALEAVLAAIGSVDAIWQLGDVVGYGPDPNGVARRLREAGAIGVRGNHDAAVLGDVSTAEFNMAAREAVEWTQERIGPAAREYLAALPLRLVPTLPAPPLPAPPLPVAAPFTLVHGSPRDPIWEYLTDTWQVRENLSDLSSRHCLVGHSHMPLVFRERHGHVKGGVARAGKLELGEGRAFLNPGSVGQPRDGDPRASYLVLDTDADVVVWQRVEYEVAATQAAMMRAGLPVSLARRLSIGR